MPRGSSITIEGQFAREVLGTFRIIRGFATLQDLATISAPYLMDVQGAAGEVQGHQRDIDPDHAEAIKRYLERGTLRFLPEVILSIRAEFRNEVDEQQHVLGVISDSTPGLRIKRRWKSSNIRTHQIIVDVVRNPELLAPTPVIRRIDGNHRLYLAKELAEEPTSPNKYLAPFCAVLLAPPGDANDDYVESMLFYTINSTAQPLNSEHALQLLLGQREELSPAPDTEFAESPALYLTRLIKRRMDAVLAVHQRGRLGPTPATVLHSAARAMIASNLALAADRTAIEHFAGDFCGALTDVLARLNPVDPEFCRADFFVELASLAWHDTNGGEGYQERIDEAVRTLEGMGRWLGRDGFHRIESRRSLAQQLFETFRTVRNRTPKRIFLSRWYPTDADGDEKRKADMRKQMIDRTLDDLRQEGINLALDDPGTATGATFPIHQRMYEAIANNDIILIDLSGVRPNVSIEAGYALDKHRSNRLLFMFEPTGQTVNNPAFTRPPFDLTTFRYESLTQAAEIPDKLKPHLRAIWAEAVAETP